MGLSEIVEVVITKNSANVSQAGFGTILIVGPNVNINSRIEFFSNAVDATAKIVGASTLEAAQISDAFAQNPSVVQIALGSIMASKTVVFAGTMTAGSVSGTVNGTEYSVPFNAAQDATLDDLAAAMQADDDVSTAVNTLGTIVVTPAANTTIGVEYDITSATGTTGITETATELAESYPEALALISIENDSWYGLVIADRAIGKQVLVADWAEASTKIFAAGSADATIINSAEGVDVTSLAYYIKSQSLERTFVIYGANAATEGNDAALLGKIFPQLPGTYTAMFKTLASITVDELSTTQSTNARDKNANVYEPIGGINIVREGKVGSGEYLDVIIFIDWLYSRIQESVYGALAGALKVPFTETGIAVVESALDVPLSLGQSRGGISPKAFDDDKVQIGGYFITMPRLQDISAADKTARELKDVKFTAFLAGAIHKTRIDGVVI